MYTCFQIASYISKENLRKLFDSMLRYTDFVYERFLYDL